MVVLSCDSMRHLSALSEITKKVYKKKKKSKDKSLNVEGKGTNWVALDMGKFFFYIIIHFLLLS